ncbi:MAG: hypothetical protein ACUZ8O_11525 [Candidatus Anammoxibacter sp.]
MIRQPIVAGQFYPNEIGQLKEQLNDYIDKIVKKMMFLALYHHMPVTCFPGAWPGMYFHR